MSPPVEEHDHGADAVGGAVDEVGIERRAPRDVGAESCPPPRRGLVGLDDTNVVARLPQPRDHGLPDRALEADEKEAQTATLRASISTEKVAREAGGSGSPSTWRGKGSSATSSKPFRPLR